MVVIVSYQSSRALQLIFTAIFTKTLQNGRAFSCSLNNLLSFTGCFRHPFMDDLKSHNSMGEYNHLFLVLLGILFRVCLWYPSTTIILWCRFRSLRERLVLAVYSADASNRYSPCFGVPFVFVGTLSDHFRQGAAIMEVRTTC